LNVYHNQDIGTCRSYSTSEEISVRALTKVPK
jgi:hypothetical protein